MKPHLKLFLIGAVTGTLLDGLFTWKEIAYYPNPFLFQTAWWVPFLFGGGVLLMGWSHAKLHPIGGGCPFRFVVSLVFLGLACASAALLHLPPLTKAVLLFLLYLLSWRIADQTKKSLWLALLTAIGGCAIESFLGSFGLYHYTQADIVGIPLWLPLLYLHVSAAAGNLGRILYF